MRCGAHQLRKVLEGQQGWAGEKRESCLIFSIKYNISRADMSTVYSVKTAEPFTYRLSRLLPSAFLNWFTNWNENMHRTSCYTASTSWISDEIWKTVLENNGYNIEVFHDLEPDEFIQIIAEEVKSRS